MAKITTLVLIMTLSSLLCACASSSVRTGPIPQAGLTVSQLYHEVIDENEAQALRQVKRNRPQGYKTHYAGSLAEAFKTVSQEFKPLANPAIPIYITPKVVLIGDEQIIKPGFVTQFYLFKKNQFALNSEVY